MFLMKPNTRMVENVQSERSHSEKLMKMSKDRARNIKSSIYICSAGWRYVSRTKYSKGWCMDQKNKRRVPHCKITGKECIERQTRN